MPLSLTALLNEGYEQTKTGKIMKKYEVTVKETSYGSVIVVAENECDARDKAYNAWADGKVDMGGTIDAETCDVTSIN